MEDTYRCKPKLYPGTITQWHFGVTCDILYGDRDQEIEKVEGLIRVSSIGRGGGTRNEEFCSECDSYDIHYEDGDWEKYVPKHLMVLLP